MSSSTSRDRGITINILRELHAPCTAAGVHYAILGGAACRGLGSNRTTEDVDIVVSTGTGSGQDIDSKIDALVKLSGGRFSAHTDQYGVPYFKLDGFEVEIFDPAAWPNRPQYLEFLSDGGSVYVGDKNGGYIVVSPPLLLREKLITLGDRKARAETDVQDITFLMSYCQAKGITIDLRGTDLLNVSARKGLLEYVNRGGNVYPGVMF